MGKQLKFKVGDKVKCTGACGGVNKTGKVGFIKYIDDWHFGDDLPYNVKYDGDGDFWQSERVLEPAPLEVGDRVECNSDTLKEMYDLEGLQGTIVYDDGGEFASLLVEFDEHRPGMHDGGRHCKSKNALWFYEHQLKFLGFTEEVKKVEEQPKEQSHKKPKLEPKFKVGDKVRILDGKSLKDYYGGWCMPEMIGKVVTINEVEEPRDRYCHNAYGYRMKEERYVYDERGLELVKEPSTKEEIVIYREGSKTIALNKATGKSAFAKCHEDDEYDFEIGAKIAFERLLPSNPTIVKQESYKVGDKVKIKTWEQMEKEYGLNTCGDIKCEAVFVKGMREYCDKVLTIKRVQEDGRYRVKEDSWEFSNDMILGKVVSQEDTRESKEPKKEEKKPEPPFKPGDIVEMVEDYFSVPKRARGTIVKEDGHNSYIVDFHVEYAETHYCNDTLDGKTGLFCHVSRIKKVKG